MDLKMLLSVLTIAVCGFVGILLLLPEENLEDEVLRLPWRVEQDESGRLRVFGFTLGQTTLGQIQDFFQEEGTISLFARFDSRGEPVGHTVEVYFEQRYLQRLRADFVFSLDVDAARLAALYERGLRISQAGSGAKKVKLASEDIPFLRMCPIRALTYLPWKALDADILRNRFGRPAERRLEPESGVIHWLYPEKGMDVAINRDGNTVIQYVNREDFDRLLAPLQAATILPPTSPSPAPAD